MVAIGVGEIRDNLTSCLREAQTEPILLMRYGKPIAVIYGVKGKSISEVIREADQKKSKKK